MHSHVLSLTLYSITIGYFRIPDVRPIPWDINDHGLPKYLILDLVWRISAFFRRYLCYALCLPTAVFINGISTYYGRTTPGDRYLTSSGGNISLTQTCFRDQVFHSLMTSCLIVASPCSVTLPAWTQVCRRMLPFSWWWTVTRAKKPSTTWTRPSGRPRRTWFIHIQDADARPLSTIWRSEVARGHGGSQRSVRTSRWWWWWWYWETDHSIKLGLGLHYAILRVRIDRLGRPKWHGIIRNIRLKPTRKITFDAAAVRSFD